MSRPVVYRFDVGGGAEGARLRHNVIVSGDRFTVDNSGSAPAADLTITCTAGIYLLCLYGRVEWVTTKQDGRITVVSHSNEQYGPEKEETVPTDQLDPVSRMIRRTVGET
jgi:hypothetical protein